jgi:hypothetical protein
MVIGDFGGRLDLLSLHVLGEIIFFSLLLAFGLLILLDRNRRL